PRPRPPRLLGHLTPAAARTEQLILSRIRRPCAATVSPASLASPSCVRLADFDAFAAIFIPSSATVPSSPIPSRAHSTTTSTSAHPSGTGSLPYLVLIPPVGEQPSRVRHSGPLT